MQEQRLAELLLRLRCAQPVGRDSYLDAKPSILENRPTEMIQFARGLGPIGLNIPTTSNLR